MFSKLCSTQKVGTLVRKSIGTRNLRTKPDFTKNTYQVARGDYNYLLEDHVEYFRSVLGDQRVVMDLSDLEKYNVDWFMQVRGCSSVVLKPKTTEEVSKILSFCDNARLAVCPQGGNTNVVGAAVPVFDEIIVSTELMDDIVSVDENSGILTCQAGCVLERLDDRLAESGLAAPLDIGAKGSCHIGGNVSTNAGGMRLLRYGNMHGNVLGLEVVKADGTIVDCLSSLKKDNTGYHLKHLFIGSEGTLGFVTKVSIQCPTRPTSRNVAFLGLQNFEKVLKTFKLAQSKLVEILSAVEVMDATTMEFVKEKNCQNSPIGEYPFYLMIETSGSNERHDEQKLDEFFEETLQKGLVLNGTVASEPNKIESIWSIRENITNGYKSCGAVFYYDVSVPLENYYTLVDEMRVHMGPLCERVFGYGHLGDGNLHLQIQLNEYSDELKRRAEPFVFERIAALKGSISAEHGIGFMKAKYLEMVKPESSIALMRQLKKLMDPNAILNPYKDIYNVNRGNYDKLQDRHVRFFKDLLGDNRAITDFQELEKYNHEWMRCVRGCSTLALKPKTTNEVSQILKFCNDSNLAVCPHGGNTGLVGGAVPVFDEIVLSAELMHAIIHLDEKSGVLVCQAGCILENLDAILAETGLMVPIDLASKGSCQIGGNVATNAGGLKLLRYGNLHGNVVGLEVVKADGEIIDCLSTLRKDNTGFHLKHLFIGSEGTLGFITKVALQCPTRPSSVNVSFLGLPSFEKVLKTFAKAKRDLGEILSAFEVMDARTVEFTKEKLGMGSPIGAYPFYLLVETSGSNGEHDAEKLEVFLESCVEQKLVSNGIVATETRKVNAIWSLRERVPDGFKRCGHLFCYDVSLPLEHYYLLVEDMAKHMGNLAIRVFGLGHMGDANLHIQIEVKEFSRELKNHIEPYIFERTKQLKGSISAEHGMGFLKAKYLELARPQSNVRLMKDLKRLLDPKGIMNPYKVFPW